MKIAIIIPKFDKSGPVRGALATAKGLAKNNCVTLIALKQNSCDYSNDQNIKIQFLGNFSFYKKLIFLRDLKFNNYKFITYCFSSDLMSILSGISSYSIMSIRGNLFQNYRYDYGHIGLLLANAHYFLSFFFKRVVVLNKKIFSHVIHYNSKTFIIPNFIDEIEANNMLRRCNFINKSNVVKFVYVGSLIARKGLEDLIYSLEDQKNKNWHLTIIGDGILSSQLKKLVLKKKVSQKISFLGYLDEPIKILHKFDIFILPSFSEGTSRAAMEALYCGLKCVLRDVDNNRELIETENQGYIFKDKKDLSKLLNKILLQKPKKHKKSLLPKIYSFDKCIKKYNFLLERIK